MFPKVQKKVEVLGIKLFPVCPKVCVLDIYNCTNSMPIRYPAPSAYYILFQQICYDYSFTIVKIYIQAP